MTVVAVSFDGTRVSAAETATDGGTWDKWNASQAPSVEPDFFYQGSNSLSNKVGTVAGGVEMDQSTGTHDFSTPDRIWLAKVNATNYQALNVLGTTGMILYIGSQNTTDQYHYYVHGSDTYPLAGGWVFIPVDPNVAGYRDNTVGTPDLNNVDYWGVSCDFTSTSKSENVMMDAIDYFDSGTGLTLIHGSGADPVGDMQSFVTFDEGTSGNRYGLVRTQEGIIYAIGVLSIGDGTNETDFDAFDETIVFVDGRCAAGWCGVDIDAGVTGSIIKFTGCTFIGRGSSGGTADTRPDFDITGTAGLGQYTNCKFIDFRLMTLSVGNGLLNCILDGGDSLTQNGGLVFQNTFLNGTHGDGAAYLVSDNPALCDDNNFTFNDGHAIEIDTPGTYTFTGNTFSGYGADGTTDAAIYNNSGGLVTLNIDGGGDTAPTVRNGASASTVLNNTVTLTIRVREKDGSPLGVAQCAIYQSSDDTELMNEDSNGISGNAAESFNYPGSDVAVYIRVRKSSGGTRYVNNSTTSTITSTGLDVTVVMAEDTNIDL